MGQTSNHPYPLYSIVSEEESKIVPYPFVFVNDDGTVRELHQSERSYLEMRFHPTDGGRPYIKDSYEKKDGWSSIGGFCPRSKIPVDISVLDAPAEDPTESLRKALVEKQISFGRKNGFEVISNLDGTVTLRRKK